MKEKYILILFIVLFTCQNMFAAAISWIPGVADWNDPLSWSTGTIPGPADDVTIIGTATYNYLETKNGLDVNVRSLKVENITFITVSKLTTNAFIPGTVNSLEIKNAVFQTNEELSVTGGMYIENSTVEHNLAVNFHGNLDGTVHNVSLLNSSLTITAIGFLQYISRNNNQPLGGRTDVFMIADNSNIINETDLFLAMPISAGNNGPPFKGIILENNSTFINKAKVQLLDVDVVGIELKTGSTFTNEAGSEIAVEYCTTCPTPNPNPGIIQNTGCVFSDLGSTTISRFGGIILLANIYVPPATTFTLPGTLAAGYTISGGGGGGTIGMGNNGAIQGTVSPGNSPGIMTFSESYNQPGSSFDMEIAGLSGGAGGSDGHDQVIFLDPVNKLTGVNLEVQLIDGYIPNQNDAFLLIDGSYTGTFDTIELPGDESAWQINYLPNGVSLKLAVSSIPNLIANGFGEASPKKTVHVTGGDVFIDKLDSKIIMTDPNGGCWEVELDGSGAFVTTSITCPTN